METDTPKLAQLRSEYAARLDDNRAFVSEIQRLIHTLINATGLVVLSVTGRVKELDSLLHKFTKPARTYETLDDITDICGIRVVTYFAEDVDRVAAIIRTQFDIDSSRSVDKRAADPERFGYSSLHYIAKLGDQRRSLKEYQRFTNHRFELQIRSVLQHAWAEIEHDLGYKAEIDVPQGFRRQFSRLAGLLELADEQFDAIRKGLAEHSRSLPSKIRENPGSVPIDAASIVQLLETDTEIQELEARFVRRSPKLMESRMISAIVQMATAVGLNSVKQIQDCVHDFRPQIINASERQHKAGIRTDGVAGMSLYWAILAHALATGNVNEALTAVGFPGDLLPDGVERIRSVLAAKD